MDNHVHLSFRIISMSILVVNHHFWWMDFLWHVWTIRNQQPTHAYKAGDRKWLGIMVAAYRSPIFKLCLRRSSESAVAKTFEYKVPNVTVRVTSSQTGKRMTSWFAESEISTPPLALIWETQFVGHPHHPTSDGKIHGGFRFFTMTNPRSPPPRL